MLLQFDRSRAPVLASVHREVPSHEAMTVVLTIADEAMLRARYPERSQLSGLKELDHLETHSRNFIALSPFLVIGSTRPGQGHRRQPRAGDHPGFVRVLDDPHAGDPGPARATTVSIR